MSLAVHDIVEQPPALLREVQALGDKLLPGDHGSKLVFAHLEMINQRLADDFVD